MFTSRWLDVRYTARGHVALLEPLTWTDARETITVPAGFLSDGATVPAFAWPLVGHPLSGTLIRASVLHDYEIRTRRAPWRTVHARYYRTLRASGVGWFRARLLERCVTWFGPRW